MASNHEKEELDTALHSLEEANLDTLNLFEEYFIRKPRAHAVIYSFRDLKAKKAELAGVLEQISAISVSSIWVSCMRSSSNP